MPLAVHTSFADLTCCPARGNATSLTSFLFFYHLTGTEINPPPVSSDALMHPQPVVCAPATPSHGWHHHHYATVYKLMFAYPSAASPANCRRRHPLAYSCSGAPSPRGEEAISEVCYLLVRYEV